MSINISNDPRHAGEDDGGSSSEDEEIISQFVMDIDKVNPHMQQMSQQQMMHHQQQQHMQQQQLPHQQHPAHQQHMQHIQQQQMQHLGDGHHMGGEEMPTGPAPPKKKRSKCNDLSAFTKWAIVAKYMEEANRKTDRLYTGSLPEMCQQFAVSKRTIQRIVWEYKTQIEKGIKVPDMTNKKVGRGADSKFTQDVADNIKKLKNKAKGRLTVRGMAEAYEAEYGTKISYMTLYRYDKKNAKSQKPIKYAKASMLALQQQQQQQQHHHQQAAVQAAQHQHAHLAMGYPGMNHSDLTAAFAEADAVAGAGGFHHHHHMANPSAHVFAQAAALPIAHMQHQQHQQHLHQQQQHHQQQLQQLHHHQQQQHLQQQQQQHQQQQQQQHQQQQQQQQQQGNSATLPVQHH